VLEKDFMLHTTFHSQPVTRCCPEERARFNEVCSKLQVKARSEEVWVPNQRVFSPSATDRTIFLENVAALVVSSESDAARGTGDESDSPGNQKAKGQRGKEKPRFCSRNGLGLSVFTSP
jgi:hypothetical protein